MRHTENTTRDRASGPGSVPARLADRLRAPCVFVVAPSGAGKSTLLRRLGDAVDRAAVIALGPEHRDPAVLESLLDERRCHDAATIAIDDAHLAYGTPGEIVLRRLVAEAGARHVVLASRLAPGGALVRASHREAEVLTAPDLALRIDEISLTFRAITGHALGLECASCVASDTGGWAALVHLLAIQSRLVDPDALDATVSAALQGDFGATRLEDSLRLLPPHITGALERTSGLSALEFAECAGLLGAHEASELFDAVDSGAIMHVVELGHRVVPPLLRRYLRARAGLSQGVVARKRPDPRDDPAATVGGVPAPESRAADTFDAALMLLRRGDVVGAVPLLQRAVRRTHEPSHAVARLVLLLVREAFVPRETMLDALAALERDCVAWGFDDIGRVVRGAIAATSELPDRAVQGVVEACELHADPTAAAVVGIDLLVRVRRGRATSTQATALAQRLDRLGFGDVAAWAKASGALVAAASGAPRVSELIAEAESAAIATGVDGAQALIQAARGLSISAARSATLLASSRRNALQTGLPRLPSALFHGGSARAHATGSALVHLDPRQPHLTVGCFGGFRLRTDDSEIDLRAVRPQARALLRMLALNAGSPLHRELIADILWGDLGTDSAVHALHVSVSSLRRVLPAHLAGSAAPVVERVGEAYRLGILDRRDCDLADFDDRLVDAAAFKARHDAPAMASALRGALALYVGDVLPEDGPAEWVTGARERYRIRAAEAASSLAHLELHLGEPRAAVAAATRAVEIDPWLDESWRTLVTVHRRSGDVVAASRAEDDYRRMRVALGVE